jgi:predicted kinase
MNKKIIILSGLPGTGKSTIARELEKTIPKSIVIKTANLREIEINDNFFDENIKEVKIEKDKAYSKMIEVAKEIIKNGKIPILDATFHKKERRNLLDEHFNRSSTLRVHLECSDEISKSRVKERKGNDTDEFLNKIKDYEIMKAQQDLIEKNEGFIIINTSTHTLKEVTEWITQFL